MLNCQKLFLRRRFLPAVIIGLSNQDVKLSFSINIKFMNENLDLFWHSTGQVLTDSHGIIGELNCGDQGWEY